jgi:hypothetical protein
MNGSDYWFDEAAKYKEHAAEADDSNEQKEFLELADICFDIAIRLEERATPG